MAQPDFTSIVKHFDIGGPLTDVSPLTSGHINDTYVLTADKGNHAVRYILQRINHYVFKDPPLLMDNVLRVTEHIRARVQSVDPDRASRQLTVIPADGNAACHTDARGNFWRMYNFIEDAVTCDTLESPHLAYEAARMFGWFQKMLIDLPPPPLHQTIHDFHNTPARLKTLQRVLEEDACNRAGNAKREIDFLSEHAGLCDVLLNLADKGEIPLRTTHNDTKINNVMLDKTTKKGVCVIDLDTVMPGLSLYDFGDMVRTAAASADEDERDLSKVALNLPVFKLLARGFAEETHGFLTPCEKKHLVSSAALITFEQFLRFLTDYLAGDTYYKVRREQHNLDRARTQMKLVQSIIEQQDAMNEVVERVFHDIA